MHLIMHIITACILLSANGCFAFWPFFGDMDNFSCFKYRCLPWPCCPVEWCDSVDCVDTNGFEVQCSMDYTDEGCTEQESHRENVPSLTTSSEKRLAFKTASEEISRLGNSLDTLSAADSISPMLNKENFDYPSDGESRIEDFEPGILDEENFDYPSAGESRIEDFQPEIETYEEISNITIQNEVSTGEQESATIAYATDNMEEFSNTTVQNEAGAPNAANMMEEISNTTVQNEAVAFETTAATNAANKMEDISNTTVQNEAAAPNAANMMEEISNTTVQNEAVAFETTAATNAANKMEDISNTTVQNEAAAPNAANMMEEISNTTVQNEAVAFETTAATNAANKMEDISNTTVQNEAAAPNAANMMEEISNTTVQNEAVAFETTAATNAANKMEDISNTTVQNEAAAPNAANMMEEISNTTVQNEAVACETTAAPNAADMMEEIMNTAIQNETVAPNAANMMEEISNTTIQNETAAPNAANMIEEISNMTAGDQQESATIAYAADNMEVSTSSILDEENVDYPSAGESRIQDFEPDIGNYEEHTDISGNESEIITAIPNATEIDGTLSTKPVENEITTAAPNAADIMEEIANTTVQNEAVAFETTAAPNAADMMEEISNTTVQNEPVNIEITAAPNAADMVEEISNTTVQNEAVNIETTAAPNAADMMEEISNTTVQNEAVNIETTAAPNAADMVEEISNTTVQNEAVHIETTAAPNAADMMEEISNTTVQNEAVNIETTAAPNAADMVEEISDTTVQNEAVNIETTAAPNAADMVEEISNTTVQNEAVNIETTAAPNAADMVEEISNTTVQNEAVNIQTTAAPNAADIVEEISDTTVQNEAVNIETTAAPNAADMVEEISNTTVQNEAVHIETTAAPNAADMMEEISNTTVQNEAVNIETTAAPNAADMVEEISNTTVQNEAVHIETTAAPNAADMMEEISNTTIQNEIKSTGDQHESATLANAADNMEISFNAVPGENAAGELDNATVQDTTEAISVEPAVDEMRYWNWEYARHKPSYDDSENKNMSEYERVAARSEEIENSNTAVPTLESSHDEVSDELMESANETNSNFTNSTPKVADFILIEHSTISPNVSDENVTSGEMCHHFTLAPSLIPCTENKYRTIDGTCNNPDKPALGSSGTRFQRIAPQYYNDGLHAPRNKSKDGNVLPNVRTVVELVNKQDQNRVNNTVNLMFVVWGQYIAYDVIKTHPVTDSEIIQCCSKIEPKYPKDFEDCLPIVVNNDDRFYSKHNITCLNFVRSYAEPVGESGYYEQVNAVTTFLDGSAVYGSRQSENDILKTTSNGTLRSSKDRHNEHTPVIMHNQFCQGISTFPFCFVSGDNRVNQHGALSMVHVIFHREHNRIAKKLHELNPHWDGVDIFQETRKIIGAIIQHITYNEYLPILLDKQTRKDFKLKLKKAGAFSYDYDCNIDPTIANEFSTAAFRFGQTQVTKNWIYPDSKLNGFRDTYNPARSFEQGKSFFNNLRYQLVMQPNCKMPNFMTHELTDHLFEYYPRKYGQDLASLNIQRGRDHGIAPYSIVRKHYNLTELKSFDDLTDLMDEKIIKRLKRSYSHVEDIDLFVGGYLEKPLTDGHLGQTFRAIIADQFRRLRQGDHFWYELGNRTSSFTIEQLDSIRKVTLTSLLCAPGESTAKLAMRVPCPKNPIVSCDKVDVLDLSPWLEIVNKSAN